MVSGKCPDFRSANSLVEWAVVKVILIIFCCRYLYLLYTCLMYQIRSGQIRQSGRLDDFDFNRYIQV